MLVYFKSGYDRLLHRFPGRALEWWTSLVLSTCGWVLLLDQQPPLFSRPYFANMAAMAPQAVWGWAALGIGLIRVTFLFINGTMPRTSTHLRAGGAFLALFFWFTFTLGLVGNGFASMGLAVFPWLFFADLYSLHRASTEMRLADNDARQNRDRRESVGADAITA